MSGLMAPFRQALCDNLQMMAGIEGNAGEILAQGDTFNSCGVTVIVGVTGKRKGRVVIDTRMDTAVKLGRLMQDEESISEEDVIDAMAEFTNIVSGNGITSVNNQVKGLGLMLAPPSVFFGEDIKIVSPRLSAQVVRTQTPYGEIILSVAFEGG